MADDEEPFILDSQEERELRAQVCLLAAEVTLQQFPSNHKYTHAHIIYIHTYIRCSKSHALTFETWTDTLSKYDNVFTGICGIIWKFTKALSRHVSVQI